MTRPQRMVGPLASISPVNYYPDQTIDTRVIPVNFISVGSSPNFNFMIAKIQILTVYQKCCLPARSQPDRKTNNRVIHVCVEPDCPTTVTDVAPTRLKVGLIA